MKQANQNGKFTWAVIFAWIFGIGGVGGVMYLLFTSDRTGSNALWAVPVANGKPQGSADLLKAGAL